MTATMAHLSATADDTTLSVVDNDVDHYSTPAMATVTASNSASMSADDDDDATSATATIVMIQLLTTRATLVQFIFYLVIGATSMFYSNKTRRPASLILI